MQDGENEITRVCNLLYPHLKKYLLSKEIKIADNNFFSCIHPNHNDEHPSCSIGGKTNEQVFHCFSCGTAGNIIHAVHFLEGKPLSGVGFYEETLPYLCKLYNIDYKPITISNAEREQFQKRSSVRDAASTIHAMAFDKTILKREHSGIKHLLDRGIIEQSIKKFKIGIVSSYKDYLSAMKTMGYSDEEWLRSADLANRGIFTPDGIIIPIFDDRGRPVGFVTRTTKMEPNAKGDYKYVNSINSDIYCKGEILFNFNNYDVDGGPLWIVEGYLDAIFLDQSGLKNVAALGATSLTQQHVDLLARKSVKNIILCFDGDEGGRGATKLAIERLSAFQIFKSIRIVELPEGYDPDSFVREKGLAELQKLGNPEVAISPFAWTIKHTNFQDDPIVVVETAIPTIAGEESVIKRMRMIRELAKITGISREDIKKDVDLKVNKESSAFLEELNDVNKYVQQTLARRKIHETKSILEEAVIKIKDIEKKFNNNVDNRVNFEDKRSSLWEKIETGNYKYGLIAPKFKKLEELYDGLPFTTCLTLIGGRPGSGKTSWATSLGIDLVEANPDLALFYMSIDDTTELMTLKMLAQHIRMSTSKIKQYSSLSVEDREKVRKGWSWLNNLSSRFILVDSNEGTNIETMESHIEWFMKEFPDKKKIFILDNFHKLTMPINKQKTDAVSQMSERVKDMTRIYDLHIMMTVELRKLSESNSRPSVSDLKDTVQLEYDADSILMMHNELQVREGTNIVHMAPYGDEGEKGMPYLEVYLYKNKITGRMDGLAYKLNSYDLHITEDSYATIRRLKAENAGNMKVDDNKRAY